MRPVSLVAMVLALAIALFGYALQADHAVADDEPGFTHDLNFRWTSIPWVGPPDIAVADALSGTGDAEGGTDVFDVVTAVYEWDAANQQWFTFFPAGVGVPGVNTLTHLQIGHVYWVAINEPDGAQWHLPLPPEHEVIRIGALLSVTGPGSSLGATSLAALEVAVAEWNQRLEDEESDIRFVLDVEDTQLNPALAVAGFNALVERGARAMIGPQSSSELLAIGPLADEAEVIVVSHGSTASSLAGLWEYVFRFVPTDVVEGQAITELMIEDGAAAIVRMWRNDPGNGGLAESVKQFAEDNGVEVPEAGITYEPGAENYDAELAAIAAQVADAVEEHGAVNVAVYLAGFEEVADILAAAGDVDGLDDVRWYGGDGSARATPLIETAGSPQFAVAVGGYPSPLLALPAGAEEEHADLIAAITAAAGIEPDAFALAAYDAFNALAEAFLDEEEEDLRTAFLAIASGFEGVTGIIDLNEDGDRSLAPFAFYSICLVDIDVYDWVETGLWEPGAMPGDPGTLTHEACELPA